MKTKPFTLKDKPKPPERCKIRQTITIYDGTSLAEILKALPADIDPEQITFVEEHPEYDEIECYFEYQALES